MAGAGEGRGRGEQELLRKGEGGAGELLRLAKQLPLPPGYADNGRLGWVEASVAAPLARLAS